MTSLDGAAAQGRNGAAGPHCRACGAKMTQGAAFCTGCGAPSGGNPPAPAFDPPVFQPGGSGATHFVAALSRKSGFPWLKAGAAVLGVAAIADGISTMMSGARQGTAPAPYTGMQLNAGWPAAQPNTAASPEPGQPSAAVAGASGLPGGAVAGADNPPGQGPSPAGYAAQQGPASGPPMARDSGAGPDGQGVSLAAIAVPTGMTRLPSPVGAVFRSQMGGSPRASVLAAAAAQSLEAYFDTPPQVVNQQADPSDQKAQIVLRGQKEGRQLGGMILVKTTGPNAGLAYLILDDASQVERTASEMTEVAQHDLQAQQGG